MSILELLGISFWCLIPLFSFVMLFIKSTHVFDFINPRLPFWFPNLVNRYVNFFYGNFFMFFFNIIHIIFFTLWGFALRIVAFSDYTTAKAYVAYYLFYFFAGATLRFWDSFMCFLFLNYNKKLLLFGGPEDSFDLDHDVIETTAKTPPPPPNTFPRPNIPKGGPRNTNFGTLYQRIVTGKTVKGTCAIIGLCFVGWNAYEIHHANVLHDQENRYNFFKGERDQLNRDLDRKDISRDQYDQSIKELKRKFGIDF